MPLLNLVIVEQIIIWEHSTKVQIIKLTSLNTHLIKLLSKIGVETPSQSRFVGYYDIITNNLGGVMPPKKILTLSKVLMYSVEGEKQYYFTILNSLIIILYNNKKGLGNSDGSDFSMTIYLSDRQEAANCVFGKNINCKVLK